MWLEWIPEPVEDTLTLFFAGAFLVLVVWVVRLQRERRRK